MQDMQLHSEDAGRLLQVSQYGLGIGIGWVDERGNDGRRWYQLVRQLQSLRHYLHVQLGHARDVAAWPIEASDETELHRIAGGGEDNGNRRNRRFYRLHSRAIGDDHCHLTTNQLSRQRRHSVVLPASPAILNRHVLTLYSLFPSSPDETRPPPPSARMHQAMRR